MAWKIVSGFKKLIVRYSNGHGDEVYENVAFPSMRMTDATSLVTNGFTSYDTGLLGAANYQQPDLYALYSSFASNGLNLVELLGNLNSNGEYFEIYNPEIGSNYRIRFTRKSAYSLEIRYFVYSQSTGTGYNISLIRNEASYFDSKHCFGFVADIPNGRANIVFRYNWQYNESTPGHTIAYYRVNNGPYVNQDICSQCLMGLILANEMPEPPTPTGDPYEDGGYSDEDGGGGSFDFTSDTISEPSLPSLSAQASKLVSIYQVDSTQMASFANYLWSPGFQWSDIQKIFANVMDAIIGLGVLPFTPTGGTTQNIIIGDMDSQVSSTLVASQYATVDCGTLAIDEAYASALDYNPYTKIDLILPYCGTVPLDPDEVMGKTIGVKYSVDLLTGACLALVSVDSSLLFTVAGNVMSPIPLTGNDFSNFYHAISASAIGGIGAAVAVAGGLSAPIAAGGATLAFAANMANAKEQYSHGSAGQGNTGLLGPQKPYIVMKRPAQCLPDNNNNYQGYPSFITENLGNLSGFTKVAEIHLENLPITDIEKKELLDILRRGVIL